MLRSLALASCAALVSCHSVIRVEMPRAETSLSTREKRHMAAVLDHMAAGWDAMHQGPSARRRQAQDQYDQALASFLREWDDHQSPRYWQTGTVFTSGEHSFQIDFDPKSDPRREVAPAQMDQIILASRRRSHAEDTLSERPGIGVPVVGHVTRTNEARKEHPFMPPNGGNLTLTAVMEVDADDGNPATPRRCRLHLHNALNVETVKIRQDERLLAANFTAAKDRALSRKSLRLFSWLGLLYPERTLGDCQLYRMDSYDPRRIPVVFVHGLMSDPHIWLNVVNAISSDPELRKKYQPWYFLYPTGMSVPQTSARLRASLQQARDYYDPDHNDPGMNRMILVGHSMGGLLSRMQAIDPKDKLWNSIFSKPPEQLNVSASERARLVGTLKFKPQSQVKRLVFITTPHRGSSIAGMNIVRRLASLIRLPVDTLLVSQQLLTGNTDALNPQIRDWGFFAFLSLGTLSDEHPFYQGLNSVPIPVPYHSVIGQFGRKPLLESSDGAVPYSSAHLDGAKSEKVVPCWHGCVERPEVVQEVVRILREHLRESGTL
ncbi:esterase/lipase family protein [Prosthecobacter sp.]|uniref:esterase/lipase family protein n=1 Tax=Prosthecobacter sp. TaxID=1965333 RepID=UPI0037830A07